MKKHSKVYRQLLFSYLFIFLIPIILGIVFYLYVYQISKEQTDTFNQKLIQTVKETSDRETEAYQYGLIQLALNKSVQELSAVKGEFKPDNSYALYSLRNDIINILVSNNRFGNHAKDLFVYFSNSDKVVSAYGSMDLPLYYQLYCENENMNLEEFRSYLSQNRFQDAVRVGGKGDAQEPYLLFTMTNLKGDIGETTAMIGLRLDVEALNQIMQSVVWERGVIPVIIDSQNNQLTDLPAEVGVDSFDYASLKQGTQKRINWQDEDYIVQVMDSDVMDWKYVLMMPEKLISGNAGKIKNIFVVGSIVCLLAGIWASHTMIRMNYNPIKALFELFQKHKGGDEEEAYENNEYAYLQNKALSLLKEHADFRQMLSRDREIVKQYYLTRLLENPYDEAEQTQGMTAAAEGLQDGAHRVLLFSVDTGREKGEKEADYIEKSNLKRFIISNVFGEGISEHFKQEIVELGSMVAMIVTMPAIEQDNNILLKETIDTLQKFIQDNFGFQVAVVAGELHQGLSGIHKSFLEARETEEFITLLEPDFISYSEIKNTSHKKYDYPTDKETKILTAMKSRNCQLAASYIDNILDTNYKINKTSPVMLKCLIYDLIGTVMKASQEMGNVEISDESLDLKDFSVKLPLKDIKANFLRLVQNISEEMPPLPDSGGSEQGGQLSQKVMEYIKENFRDPDLNISQTGLYFHMTPAYLSSIFKKQTGESLLKVINQIRIEEAEKLLAEGLSVVEVAERVGFRESSTFIRAFKKATGITPGQLKGK